MAPHSSHTLRHVFVSHSSSDNAFGYGLTDWLRAELGADYDVFYDSHGGEDDSIPAGEYWQDVIQTKLMAADVFVVIETPAAMNSKWVQDEVGLAWSRKNSARLELGLVIAPVLLETCAVPPWLTLIQYADLHAGADEAEERARLLAAIRRTTTLVKPMEVIGPPFDLSELRPADHFIGRATDVEWVMKRLTGPADVQLANIAAANGQGGIGKTALAAEAVRRLMTSLAFPDGIAALDCRDQHSEADALGLLQMALSRFAPGRQKPEDDSFAALGDVARQLLGGKHALVVLDNVEADLPASKIVASLRTAGAAVLLTSRTPLPAAQGASLRLDLLPEEDALTLFATTYGEPTGRALSKDELVAARRIVVALGRHTLAVKLAAAYAATEGRDLTTLAEEFEHNPLRDAWLENSEVAVTTVLATSAAAMSPGGQRLYAALGAFTSADVGRHAALALAEALGDDENEAERSLHWVFDMRLADSARIELPAKGADCERLHLHPLIQAHARDIYAGRRNLPDIASWDDSQRELVNFSIATWYAYYSTAMFGQGGVAYLALMPDEKNIDGALESALEQGDDDLITQLCNGMRDFWRDTGRWQTGLHWLPVGMLAAARIAEETEDYDDCMYEANIAAYFADLLRFVGKLDEAEAIYKLNLSQRRALGDRAGEGLILSDLGHVALIRGRLGEAGRFFKQSLAISQSQHNLQGEGSGLSNLGQVALAQGRLEEAQHYFEESQAIVRMTGDRQDEGAVLSNLGQAAFARGQLEEAESYLQESLRIRREVSDKRGEGIDLTHLGQVALQRGLPEEAERYFRESLPIHRELSDSTGENVALLGLGRAILFNGRLDEAESILKQCLPVRVSTGDRKGEAITLASLGQIEMARGHAEAAQNFFNVSLPIRHEVGDVQGESTDLYCLAMIAEEQNDLSTAEQRYREALALSIDLRDDTNAALLQEVLGAFLILHGRGTPGEGCVALSEATKRWERIGRSERASRTRWISQDLGCP